MTNDYTLSEAVERIYRLEGVITKQDATIIELRTALREAASDFEMSLQIDKQKDAKIEQLTMALQGVVDDEPCWLDHHGYCQTHGLNKPCEMAIARAALEEKHD